MTTRTSLDELNEEQHGAGRFDWIKVIHPDESRETIWQREARISSGDSNERSSPMRLLAVEASDPDAVRQRIRELGYANNGSVPD